MSIAEAVRRLLFGTPLERATVDLAHIAEAQPAGLSRAAYLADGERPRDLTPGQLKKLRDLNPAFARTEAATLAAHRERDVQRRRVMKKSKRQ